MPGIHTIRMKNIPAPPLDKINPSEIASTKSNEIAGLCWPAVVQEIPGGITTSAAILIFSGDRPRHGVNASCLL